MSGSPPTTAAAASAACSNCGDAKNKSVLHRAYHRSTLRHLCTACVLNLNLSSFCPLCFSLHPPRPLLVKPPSFPASNTNTTLVTCFKCYSSTHAACLPPNTPTSPYRCPHCSLSNRNPNPFSSFNNLDLHSSKAFLAAATIALNSLRDAEHRMTVELERRAREAVAAEGKGKKDLAYVNDLQEALNREELGISVGSLALKRDTWGSSSGVER